jgi:signal transduction histidine kinase
VPAYLVVSVMHDITAPEHLDQLRDQFFAAVAHSLKSPVAIIKANAQVLSRSAPRPLQPSTGAIERQCGRIDRLVENLLVLSRVRTKTLQLHPRVMELGPLVASVAREMASAAQPKREVRIELAADARVHGDQERLAMVLRNLLDEAVRSSPRGSPLTVLLTQHGRDARIAIRHQSLEPAQLESDALGDYDDLGIGRGVTATIVEAHGGVLHQETEGPEATAWFELPILEGAHAHV